jgi:hypothetical protein
MAGLAPPGLADVLEEILARDGCPDPVGRASIYSLLAELGKAPTAALLLSDYELRHALPVQWLDLVLPTLTDIEERQRLVFQSVRSGVFGIEHFSQRLDEMRRVAGRHIGDWLNRLRSAFPIEEREAFDLLVAEAFGPVSHAQDSMVEASVSGDRLSKAPAIQRLLGHFNSAKTRSQRELVPA